MPSVANLASITLGHPPSANPHGPFSAVSGSPSVFVEGSPALRKGDPFPPHSPSFVPNARLVGGSSTVFADGLPLGRKGDRLDCGDSLAKGSSTVDAG